jgi:hypothetical protein
MHCSANVGDKDDTAIFFGFLEPENNFISRSKRKLVMMNMDGLVKTPFLILKADATLR